MADDQLNTIVQRMIDAGESEENIGTVIQHFKPKYQPDQTMQAETQRALASQTSYVPPRKVTDELGNEVGGMAEGRAKNFVRNVVQNPAVQHAAYPSSLSDLAALMIPDAPGAIAGALQGGKDTARAVGRAITKVPMDAVDADVVSIFSPRGGAALRKAQQLRAALSTSPQQTSAPASAAPIDISSAASEARAARAARFGSERGWAAQLAQNPDGWRVDASALTPEQTAAQAAVHNAPVAPSAPAPVSGPQGVPPSAQVPSSFAALLRPPSPAQVANVEALVARGQRLTDAIRTVSRGDAELGARLMTALQAKQ